MKFAFRSFINAIRRFKTATFLNVIGLSVAFASSLIIMMQVDYDLNFDKKIPNSEYIYRVDAKHGDGSMQAVLPRPLGELLPQSSPHIVAGTFMTFWSTSTYVREVTADGFGDGYMLRAQYVTPSHTSVFNLDMVEGTDKSLEEPDKILIPEHIARRIYGNRSALNKTLDLENHGVKTIGGVYKDFPKNSSLVNCIYVTIPEEMDKNSWGNSSYTIFIRVDSHDAIEQLNSTFKSYMGTDLPESWNDIELDFTQLPEVYYKTGVSYDNAPKSSRQTIAILFAIACVIIIIAGVNFTNFTMALTPARIRSINTQKVLGATILQLRIAMFVEAVCTSLIAFFLSLVFVNISAHTPISGLVNADISLFTHLPLIFYFFGIAILVGLLSGLYPAIYMTSFPPALVLKGNFGLSDKGRRVRNTLISFQFIVSLTLIMSAGFLYLQNRFMQNSPLGYDKDALIILEANKDIFKNWDVLKNKLESFPEIEGLTQSSVIMASGEQYSGWGRMYRDNPISFQALRVDHAFLDIMGIEVLEGRNFRKSDEDSKKGFYIFNQKAKNEFNLELNTDVSGVEIIGFIPDIKFASFRVEIDPMAFYVTNQADLLGFVYIKVKKGSNYYRVFDLVKSELAKFDSSYPYSMRFFDTVLDTTYQKEKRLSALITLFSLIAILISVVGVFGLVIFESQYRRKEISIRKVMGSTTREILLLFNRTYIKILLVCFVLSVPACYYIITLWLDNFAYKVPIYWWVFFLAGTIILFIVTATVSWQSWRAANSNPVDALKNE